MIANDDAGNDSAKSLQRKCLLAGTSQGRRALGGHRTSIQRVSPSEKLCLGENRFSINLGADKNLKGMAFILK